MANNELKDLAKELYIAGFDIFKIAKILNRNEKTIRITKLKMAIGISKKLIF